MKQFKSNFINIYEGKPIENTYIPDNYNRQTNRNNQDNYLSYKIPSYNKLEEGPEKQKRNTKKERIQKILKEIEKKKMKKIEHDGPLDKHIMQRNCLNSKIIKKDENVMII